jgi:hypothetical protein
MSEKETLGMVELESWDTRTLEKMRHTINDILRARTAAWLRVGSTVLFRTTATNTLITARVLKICPRTCIVSELSGCGRRGAEWKVSRTNLCVCDEEKPPEAAKSFRELRPATTTQDKVW